MKKTRKAARPAKPEWPKLITLPGAPDVAATIYRRTQTKQGKRYVGYTVAYYLHGKRVTRQFSDPEEARAAAEESIRARLRGDQTALQLTAGDRDLYLRAIEAVKPCGVPLDVACARFAHVMKILEGVGTPEEAARAFARQHSKASPKITVPEAVRLYIESCARDGKSPARLHQIEYHCQRFGAAINDLVSAVTPGLVSQYLAGLAVSPRTRRNARAEIGAFCKWLVLHGYLERGTDWLENVQNYAARSGEIQIFSPEEMAKLLGAAPESLVPYLVLGGFCGLRQAEIQRLDWSEVDLADGFIEVKAGKSKTDVRRLVTIPANAKAWLTPRHKASGPVCPFRNVTNALAKLARKAGVQWHKNALRHSCISYRIAESGDVARVADESGNSPAVIRSNYLRRVKPAAAAAWFAIRPEAPSNVVSVAL